MNYLPLVCTLVGAVGVLYAIIVAGMVKSAPAGNERMQQISGAIAEGAIAYLNRQLKSVAITGVVIFAIMAVTMKFTTAIGFLIGAPTCASPRRPKRVSTQPCSWRSAAAR
jgi:K(+)-stimulated pyrophosphate-energized sodium pump